MPKNKIHIDKVFQEVAKNHQEKYNPQDWTDMQSVLKNSGLQHVSLWDKVFQYFFKTITIASVSIMLPLMQTDKQNIQEIYLNTNQQGQLANTTNSTSINKIEIQDKAISNQENKNSKAQKLNTHIKEEFLTKPQNKENNLQKDISSQNSLKPVITNLKNPNNKTDTDNLVQNSQSNSENQKVKSKFSNHINENKVEPSKSIKPIKSRFLFLDSPIQQKPNLDFLNDTSQIALQNLASKPQKRRGRFWQIFRNKQKDEDIQTFAHVEKPEKKENPNLFSRIKLPKRPETKLGQKIDKVFSFLKPKAQKVDTVKVDSTILFVSKNEEKLDSVNVDYEMRKLHFGLIYPISNHKTSALKYVNQFSVHLFGGASAGVKGFEASGIGNYTNEYVEGVQLAGILNVTRKSVNGLQGAGILNFNLGKTRGIQVAGFVNASGFKKIKKEESKTLIKANMQLSTILNVDLSTPQHFQATGIVNFAREIKGLQGAGIANFADKVKGVQVAGILNFAREVKGVQVGLVNIADSVDGVPFGLLSIVRKNGYRKVVAWGNETLNANVALKMGVRAFYNIFAIGGSFIDENIRWGIGYGFGSEAKLSETFYLSVEALSYQIHESNRQRDPLQHLNLLNQFKINFTKQVKPRLGLFFAPSLNILVSKSINGEGLLNSQIAPSWTFYDKQPNDHTKVKMWFGLDLGFRF